MNDFQILSRLSGTFGDRLRVTRRYFQFHFGPGTTIYVRRHFPAGYENIARFRETAVENFPNGKELDSYMVGEGVSREWRTRWYEFCVDESHIEEVIGILLDGLDLSDDWVETA